MCLGFSSCLAVSVTDCWTEFLTLNSVSFFLSSTIRRGKETFSVLLSDTVSCIFLTCCSAFSARLVFLVKEVKLSSFSVSSSSNRLALLRSVFLDDSLDRSGSIRLLRAVFDEPNNLNISTLSPWTGLSSSSEDERPRNLGSAGGVIISSFTTGFAVSSVFWCMRKPKSCFSSSLGTSFTSSRKVWVYSSAVSLSSSFISVSCTG